MTYIQINESAEGSSKGQRGKFAFKPGKCGFWFIREIIPENCTTILTTTFEEISLWPWKCWIRLRLRLMLVSLSFEKRLSNGGQINHWLRILYIGVVFICERLVSRFFHFKLSSTSTNLMKHQLWPYPHGFEFFAIYLSVAFHKYPIRGNSDQSTVVQVNCIRLQVCKAGQKV